MRKIYLILAIISIIAILSAFGCNPTQTVTFTQTPSTVISPPITISLDYFGIRDTHWISQIGGSRQAQIQLLVVVADESGTLATWPPASMQNPTTFDMNFFDVKAMTDPIIYRGSVTGTLCVYVAAYNTGKGQITKGQIDIISKWPGLPDVAKLKDAVPDKELVGYCWRIWSAASNWGIGEPYDQKSDTGNLEVWFRIGSEQLPEPIQNPTLKPNVIIDYQPPTGVRTSGLWVLYTSTFTFTLRNNESFEFPIYWRLDTTSNPMNVINFVTYPTEGEQDVPGNDSVSITAKYLFYTSGNYQWTYIAEYPKGTPITSWAGTLTVSP